MKLFLGILLVILVSTTNAGAAWGPKSGPAAQEGAANLRGQLSEVLAKEAELQARVRQLDEDLRPENIAFSIAGVGTTKPEELRDQRRRQLESEKARVRAQLDLLAQSRTRLEAAIAAADAEAYRRSAQPDAATSTPQPLAPPAAPAASTTPIAPKKQRRARARRRARRQ